MKAQWLLDPDDLAGRSAKCPKYIRNSWRLFGPFKVNWHFKTWLHLTPSFVYQHSVFQPRKQVYQREQRLSMVCSLWLTLDGGFYPASYRQAPVKSQQANNFPDGLSL